MNKIGQSDSSCCRKRITKVQQDVTRDQQRCTTKNSPAVEKDEKEMNEKYEREKQEHQECMKAKEKEKERQMEERARMKESSTENVATVLSVII